MTITYQTILDAEAAITPGTVEWALREDVNAILAAVEDNSADDAGRIEDIKILLAGGDHNVSRPWFAALGIIP